MLFKGDQEKYWKLGDFGIITTTGKKYDAHNNT